MLTSILNSTKKMLGISPDYEAFDEEILMFINSSLSSLKELGVGETVVDLVEDDTAVWDDLSLSDDAVSLVKIYIFLKVRMLFDPPGTSFLIEAIERQIAQQEWRLVAFHDESAAATYATPV